MTGATQSGDPDATLAAEGSQAGPRDDEELVRGTTVGRHVITSRLGSGGMGVVYAAIDPELDRKVALKFLHDDRGGTQGRARLFREAQAMARLHHPNVVSVHDVGSHGDRVYIAMEFVDGQTLTEWLQQRRRTWKETLAILRQAAEGLAVAHDKGIVHRDFKPDNVMVDAEGGVRVMDFGLARGGDSAEVEPEQLTTLRSGDLGSDSLTRTGAMLGTPRYMSPEQLSGRPADARSDQFSLCVSMWEALYGQRPFAGATLPELALEVSAGRRQEPPKDTKVPGWLHAILVRGLAVDPAERWPSVRALIEAIDDDPTPRRRRWLALGLVGVVVAGGFGVSAYRQRAAQRVCEQRAAAIDETWNPDALARLREGWREMDPAFVAETLERLGPLLDAYAADWSAARVAACHASDGVTPDPPERAAEVACLEDHRRSLSRFVDSLAEGTSRQVVGRSIFAAHRLPAVAECADERFVAQRRPTGDAAEDAALTEARAQLEEASILRGLGQYGRAQELTRRAETIATEHDDLGLRARAAYALGALQGDLGQYEEAVATLEAAAFRAASVGDRQLVVDANLSRASALGLGLSRYDDSLAVYDLVWEALVDQGRQESAQAAQWHNDIGIAKQAKAAYDDAVEHYRTALRLWEATLGPHDPRLGKVWSNLGTLEVDRGNYEEAGRYHRQAIEVWKRELGARHPEMATSMGNLGGVEHSLGHYDEAQQLYEDAIEIWTNTLGPDHPDLTTTYTNLGATRFALGDVDGAAEAFARAIDLGESALGPDALVLASPLGNLAMIETQRGEADAATEHLRRALRIEEKAYGPDHPSLAFSLNGLGDLRRRAEDYDEARRLFQRAIDLMEKGLGPDHPDLGHPLNNLARVEFEVGDYETAAALGRRAVAVFAKGVGPDHPSLIVPLRNLGEAELKLGATTAALEHYERALKIHEATLADADASIATTKFDLARALVAAGRDRTRARALAQAAADRVRRVPARAEQLAELERWLDEHP